MDFVIIHGFNVRDGGKESIDKIINPLKELCPEANIIEADYGWLGFFGVRFFTNWIAKNKIAPLIPDGATVICHSHGAVMALKTVYYGAKIKNLVLINPALDKDTQFPCSIEKILVYANEDDWIVSASMIRPFLPWGEMGRTGYIGYDERVQNIFTKPVFRVSGHSDIFNRPYVLTMDILNRLYND